VHELRAKSTPIRVRVYEGKPVHKCVRFPHAHSKVALTPCFRFRSGGVHQQNADTLPPQIITREAQTSMLRWATPTGCCTRPCAETAVVANCRSLCSKNIFEIFKFIYSRWSLHGLSLPIKPQFDTLRPNIRNDFENGVWQPTHGEQGALNRKRVFLVRCAASRSLKQKFSTAD
jgi:hypothetical protein